MTKHLTQTYINNIYQELLHNNSRQKKLKSKYRYLIPNNRLSINDKFLDN